MIARVARWVAPVVCVLCVSSTALGDESAALEREPEADAPGVTPIDERARSSADEAEQRVRLSGYLRVRGDLGVRWDLGHGPTPSATRLWPSPYSEDGASDLQTHLDLRLRADLEVTVGWGVSVHARFDVLDGLVLGSTPEEGFTGGVVSQRSPSGAVAVRRAYGQVLLPFGVLSAGRMGALIDWGTGFLVSAGEALDDDFGDVGDRLALSVPLAGLIWNVAFEISASGPTTADVRPDVEPALDLDPADDVRTIALAVARWHTPSSLRRRRGAGRTTFDAGVLASYRWQRLDLAPGASPTSSSVVARGLDAGLVDVWARLDIGRVTLEAEAALLALSIDNASLDPVVALAVPVTGLAAGGVARVDVRGSSRFFFRLELGVASGDSHAGFGVRQTGTALPGDLDGPQIDLTRSPADTTLDNFRFHPSYRVDLILFRRLLGTVTDAAYVRPMARWRVWSMLTLEGAVIASTAILRNSTPSGEAPLGVETDIAVEYEQEHGFVARLDYGLLLPLAGFRNVALGRSPSVAHALHLLLAYRY